MNHPPGISLALRPRFAAWNTPRHTSGSTNGVSGSSDRWTSAHSQLAKDLVGVSPRVNNESSGEGEGEGEREGEGEGEG